MNDLRAEVLEVSGKPIEKSKKRGLFGRRPNEPVAEPQTQPQAEKKPVAATQQYKESPWVQRAQAGKLPATEYDSSEIAQGRQVISQARQESEKARRVKSASAKLGLDQPDA